jgi:uncharacterized protein (TIGR01777 family)
MRILVTGATGLIGAKLTGVLENDGHTVIALTRRASIDRQVSITWDPESGKLDPNEIEGFDAVIHLAGENIGGGRWTDARKARILNSRVNGTRLLCDAIEKLQSPPKVLISSSAIGYYGDRGDALLNEASGPGSGFLPDVCVAWEKATESAATCGVRVVLLRTGIVQTPEGGSLQRMLLPFKLGIGGKFGNGKQWWSWIGIEDVTNVIQFALMNEKLAGPVNLVAPHPVTNDEFTKILARVLKRPAITPIPQFALKLLLGEMADGLLFSSARVEPKRLSEAGYQFHQTELEPTLRSLLSR